MNANPRDWIHAYLDDTLTDEQWPAFNQWLASDPEHRRQFAALVMMHDQLRGEFQFAEMISKNQAQQRRPFLQNRLVRTLAILSAAACLLIAIALVGRNPVVETPAAAAMIALERILETTRQAKDRTYLVTTADADGSSAPIVTKGAPQPPIDGALLHVRGPNSYVLVRRFADGSEFVTGCDGRQSWSIPPRGKVRVSNDPFRFRGAVPGVRHDIPFIDIRENLDTLSAKYVLSVTPDDDAGAGWQKLEAVRKAGVSGGPKEITLWYDANTGSLHRMLLDRLPQARGGPRSLLLTLTDEGDKGPTFFQHLSHHAADREIVQE